MRVLPPLLLFSLRVPWQASPIAIAGARGLPQAISTGHTSAVGRFGFFHRFMTKARLHTLQVQLIEIGPVARTAIIGQQQVRIVQPVHRQHRERSQVHSQSRRVPLIDMFRNKEIEIDVSLTNIKTVYETFRLPLVA